MRTNTGRHPGWKSLAASAAVVACCGAMITAPASADTGTGTSTVTVSVKGLPDSAKAVKSARVRFIGPTGDTLSRVRRVGDGKTFTGLAPGRYAISAKVASVPPGNSYQPNKPIRWILVKSGAAMTATVRYSEQQAGIPVRTGNKEKIDMTAACRYNYNDPMAEARWRSGSDPYSWFCVLGNGEGTPGIDLNKFCKRKAFNLRFWLATLFSNNMSDWWCVEWNNR